MGAISGNYLHHSKEEVLLILKHQVVDQLSSFSWRRWVQKSWRNIEWRRARCGGVRGGAFSRMCRSLANGRYDAEAFQ